MEITFQNKRDDYEAFYDYMVTATARGKTINTSAYRTRQTVVFLAALTIGAISWAGLRDLGFASGIFLLAFIIFEAIFFMRAGFKPTYYYGKQVYRQQDRFNTPRDLQIFSLPRKLFSDNDWLEISNSETSHRYRWRIVDHIGLTPEYVFIHVDTCHVFCVPKRDFASEEQFVEFGKTLLELKEKSMDQPIGAG